MLKWLARHDANAECWFILPYLSNTNNTLIIDKKALFLDSKLVFFSMFLRELSNVAKILLERSIEA